MALYRRHAAARERAPDLALGAQWSTRQWLGLDGH